MSIQTVTKPKMRNISEVVKHAQAFLLAARTVGWKESGKNSEGDTMFVYPSTGETCSVLELYERFKAHGVEAL